MILVSLWACVENNSVYKICKNFINFESPYTLRKIEK